MSYGLGITSTLVSTTARAESSVTCEEVLEDCDKAVIALEEEVAEKNETIDAQSKLIKKQKDDIEDLESDKEINLWISIGLGIIGVIAVIL